MHRYTLLIILLACCIITPGITYAARPDDTPNLPRQTQAVKSPLAPFTAAMRPAFVGDVAAHADMPRYDLTLRIDPTARRLDGTERIDYLNRSDAPLDTIALRLYPNFPRDAFGQGGNTRMDVTDAAVHGQQVSIRTAARQTAVLVPLDPPLAPGAWTTLDVSFTATIKQEVDGSWPLPSYYPMLAVYQDGQWRLDVTNFPDKVFAESTFYHADVTAPAKLSVVATGSTIATQPHDDGTTTYTIVSGPVREWALTVGDFRAAHASAKDVAVNVYTVRGSSLDAQQIATVAANALQTFERRFGAYPYRELDLHLLPGPFDGGDEYPGMIIMTSDGQVDAGTRYVAAHEVAHQWWYGVVGDDIFHQPWLDEAFAQYSAIIYDEDMVGAAVAQSDWQREVVRRYQGALADGDLPVGRAINQYPNFNVYYRTVYGKGAVFLRQLRHEVGDEVFFNALQSYFRQHRYGVATTMDVQHAFEVASGRDLAALFNTWVQP